MKYQQYLRFNRKLRRIKETAHAAGRALAVVGFALFMLLAAAADGLTTGMFVESAAVCFALMAAGAGLERI